LFGFCKNIEEDHVVSFLQTGTVLSNKKTVNRRSVEQARKTGFTSAKVRFRFDLILLLIRLFPPIAQNRSLWG